MIGSFRRRNCTCKKKRCTCGSKWTYRYHITDPKTGKRKQKETRGFNSKEEAEEEAKRILAELQQGTFIEEKDISFEAFAAEWFETYKRSGKVKPSTIDIRRHRMRNLTEHFGKIKIRDITKMSYQKFLNEMIDRYARKTVASMHEVGRLIFSRAVELEVVSKDITEYVEMPKKIKTVEDLEGQSEMPRYLEGDELAYFLNGAENSNIQSDYITFLTLAYTGLRVGELCALKWRDIDLTEQTISVTKTIYRQHNGRVEGFSLLTPKTLSSKRTIDIDEFLVAELERHKRAQKVISLDDRQNDFAFTYPDGNPFRTEYIARRMKVLVRRLNLPESISPHSLRHTHTSLLAEAGVALEVIQKRLGHHSDVITKKIYYHVTKPKSKEASQKFAELMRGHINSDKRGQNVGKRK